MPDHCQYRPDTAETANQSAPRRRVITLTNTIGALAVAAIVHFMPGARVRWVVCADMKSVADQVYKSGFDSALAVCEQIRPASAGSVIGYFSERLDRIISIVISPERRARNMGITVDQTLDFNAFASIVVDGKSDYNSIRTSLMKHAGKHDEHAFSAALDAVKKKGTSKVNRPFIMLQEALKRDAPTDEIRRIMRFLLSQGQYNGIFQSQFVEGDASSESLVRKAEGVTGMPNAEGRINRMTTVLNPYFNDGMIDILRRKSADGKPFSMDVYYSDAREFSDFTRALEEADIPDIGKYLRFIDTSRLWEYEFNRKWPWIRDNYVMLKDKDGKPLVLRSKPHYLIGKAENNIPDVAGFFGDMPVRQASVIFRGGNIRQTEDVVFIGWDEILYNSEESTRGFLLDHFTQRGSYPDNWEPRKSDIRWALDHFGREFGKKVVVVGRPRESAGPQHIYHLDVFFTPLGGRDIALGDIDADWMRHISADLRSQWYRIFPIPIKVGGNSGQNAITYNNVLIERFVSKDGKETKRVYLPQYADRAQHRDEIATLDARAVEAWRKTGFEVVTVRMDIENINMNGSLDCRVNEARE